MATGGNRYPVRLAIADLRAILADLRPGPLRDRLELRLWQAEAVERSSAAVRAERSCPVPVAAGPAARVRIPPLEAAPRRSRVNARGRDGRRRDGR